MDKETMRDHINVLYSDSEEIESIADDLGKILLLSQKSVNAVRDNMNKLLENEPSKLSEINYAVLRSAALSVIGVLDAMDITFNIFEDSTRKMAGISAEICGIATIISDDCEAQRE